LQTMDMPGLEAGLRALDGRSYPAYRDLRGRYAMGVATLDILHVQPDPFAPASRLRVVVPLEGTGLSGEPLSPASRLASEDFLARGVESWLRERPEVGSIVRIDPSVQQMLRRSALTIDGGRLSLLLDAQLPARGRRIEGPRAAEALARGLPRMIRETLLAGSYDASALRAHRAASEDHASLLGIVEERGWVAFLADGSRLARRSGEEDTPLEAGAVPLIAPEELAAEIVLPHAGRTRGTAIRRGVTLLCGGGFHGKSTLLRALAVGIYPHIPGDGRERIAADPTACMVRAEDGRAVTGVDLRPFLRCLPDGSDPAAFTTRNASGATSQAAAIIEAIGSGCRTLLIDEDTSATNFLLRDPWMGRLLRPEQEPIIPLLSRLREIHERLGVSTVLVVGGSGEAFRVADRAIVMDAYRPRDASARVAELRGEMGQGEAPPETSWPSRHRTLLLRATGPEDRRVRSLGPRRVTCGRSEIDLSASHALVHASQGRTLAMILESWIAEGPREIRLPEGAVQAAERIAREGPGAFSRHQRGDLAEVRAQEIAMMANRMRITKVDG